MVSCTGAAGWLGAGKQAEAFFYVGPNDFPHLILKSISTWKMLTFAYCTRYVRYSSYRYADLFRFFVVVAGGGPCHRALNFRITFLLTLLSKRVFPSNAYTMPYTHTHTHTPCICVCVCAKALHPFSPSIRVLTSFVRSPRNHCLLCDNHQAKQIPFATVEPPALLRIRLCYLGDFLDEHMANGIAG